MDAGNDSVHLLFMILCPTLPQLTRKRQKMKRKIIRGKVLIINTFVCKDK